jgi:hypothetical protein
VSVTWPASPPPAPAPPARPPHTIAAGDAIEVDRTVNAVGVIRLAGTIIILGSPLAGQRVIVRMAASLMAIVSGGTVVRTLPCPIPLAAPARLIMVATQRIQVGMIHIELFDAVSRDHHAGPKLSSRDVETTTAATGSSKSVLGASSRGSRPALLGGPQGLRLCPRAR